jgi:hypothetical protein
MGNISITWDEPSIGSSFSILYNRIGRHIYAVGNTRYVAGGGLAEIAPLDIYQEPRGVFDLVLNQRLPGGFRMRLTAKDLFASEEVYTYRNGNPYRSVESNTRYSLGFRFEL